jgi:uncharacterized protein YecA (UPF0149 family)
MTMQETIYRDRDGDLQRKLEMFNLPADGQESALRQRYDRAIKQVFGEGGELLGITQRKIGRNDPCPCRSGMKFKRCCEAKLNAAIKTNGH